MKRIQATDVIKHFFRLLCEVERGKRFAITKHGEVVAQLVPARDLDQSKRAETIQGFLNARNSWRAEGMSIDEILESRHAGHRI